MVAKYFVPLVMLFCGFCLTQSVLAAGLTINPEQDTVELGKPIWLTLRSDQTKISLDTLDLSPWQDKVVLPRSYSANTSEDQQSQIMKLKVYPYHAGTLTLPGLYFLSRMNQALHINVTPARDGKQHLPIDFQCHVSTQQPWQQQQVIVACRIRMANAYAVFRQPRMDRRDDLQVFYMQVRKRTGKQQGVTRTHYELGWVITPVRAGKLLLRLPPIQYVQDGVVTRQFFVHTQYYTVRARPAWLPGTIPFGNVRVSQYAMGNLILNTGVLNHIQLSIQLDGIPATAIPDYALQLRSDKALRYYAAQRKLQTRIDAEGLHQHVTEDIPVVAARLGIQRLPDIRLQYFDPGSGTLQTSLISGPWILVLNHGLSALLLLCLAAMLFWLLRVVLRHLLRVWWRFRTYQLAKGQLLQAQTVNDIKQAMQTIARAEGWSTNLTYQQWQQHMLMVTTMAREFPVSALNAASYAQAELSISMVAKSLLRIIRHRQWRAG